MLPAGVLDRVDQHVVEEALQEGGELEHLAQLEDEGGEDELEQQQQQQVGRPREVDARLQEGGLPQEGRLAPRVRGGQAAA